MCSHRSMEVCPFANQPVHVPGLAITLVKNIMLCLYMAIIEKTKEASYRSLDVIRKRLSAKQKQKSQNG